MLIVYILQNKFFFIVTTQIIFHIFIVLYCNLNPCGKLIGKDLLIF